MKKIILLMACLSVCLFSTANAHLGEIGSETNPVEFSGFGESSQQSDVHFDADPFKGSLLIYAKNTGSFGWTDFHIKITDPYNQGIENVFFYDAIMGGMNPTSSQGGLTWVINNDPSGATIDLYFTDVVEIGQLAWFEVYTDNTTDKVDFGVCFYPTVPEPTTIALLGLGAIGLLRKRK